MSNLHLTIKNRHGSVQHYYHYLLGYLVPLVRAMHAVETDTAVEHVLVPTCHTMDRITREIGFAKVSILGKDEHQARARERFGSAGRQVAEGFDAAAYYQRDAFDEVHAELGWRLSRQIAVEQARLALRFPGGGPRIVLIDRGEPDPFYATAESDGTKTSGRQRRSIPNFAHLVAAMQIRYGPLVSEQLEEKPLAFQIALFGSADIVVAQHGAALANLIWARPGIDVIEICPALPHYRERSFGALARCLEQHPHEVVQADNHAAVDIGGVVSAVDQAVAGFGRRRRGRFLDAVSSARDFCRRGFDFSLRGSGHSTTSWARSSILAERRRLRIAARGASGT